MSDTDARRLLLVLKGKRHVSRVTTALNSEIFENGWLWCSVLARIGLRPAFSALLKEVLLPIGARLEMCDTRLKQKKALRSLPKALTKNFYFWLCTRRLFGSDEDRVTAIKGQETETEDWGGSTLDDHHSFIVQYRPTDDKQLCGKIMASGITQSWHRS